jgi:methylamine dehydrogenase accessory protein MauD
LGLLALSLSRLLGLVYQRLGPGIARPLAEGPDVGSSIEEIKGTTVWGEPWLREFPSNRDSLLVFVSPQCLACNELMPHVHDFLEQHGSMADVVLVSVLGDLEMNRAYLRFAKLDKVSYLVGDRFAAKLEIAATPYALKVERTGRIAAKGVVNHFEHLVSLWRSAGAAQEDSKALGTEVRR